MSRRPGPDLNRMSEEVAMTLLLLRVERRADPAPHRAEPLSRRIRLAACRTRRRDDDRERRTAAA